MFFDHFGLVPDRGGATLDDVLGAFSTLPWENLTKFLRKIQAGTQEEEGASLLRGPATVISEHVEFGAGGTCFSLTAALAAVLRVAGFACSPAMADMNHGRNIHCALLVDGGSGLFLADPGYLVPVPVPLDPSAPSTLVLEGTEMRWDPSDGGAAYDLTTIEDGRPQWRYRLRTAPVPPREFRTHWEASFDAPGMNSLHLNRRTGEGRISAHNHDLRVVRRTGRTNEKLGGDFAVRVSELFGLSPALAAAADEAWRAACAARRTRPS